MAACLSYGEDALDAILEVFILIVNRTCKVDEQTILLEPIMQKMEAFHAYLEDLMHRPYSDAVYSGLIRLTQLFHDLGTKQLTFKKTHLLKDLSFTFFLKCILSLTGHESEYLASMMLDFWLAALKHEAITSVFFSLFLIFP
jgi:hypothetical protein